MFLLLVSLHLLLATFRLIGSNTVSLSVGYTHFYLLSLWEPHKFCCQIMIRRLWATKFTESHHHGYFINCTPEESGTRGQMFTPVYKESAVSSREHQEKLIKRARMESAARPKLPQRARRREKHVIGDLPTWRTVARGKQGLGEIHPCTAIVGVLYSLQRHLG